MNLVLMRFSARVLNLPSSLDLITISCHLILVASVSSTPSKIFQTASESDNFVGYSIPLANCSASVASSTAPATRRFVDRLHGPHFDAQFFESFYDSAQALGERCQATIGGPEAAGPYMNSAVVARDLVSFLDAYTSSNYSLGVASPNTLNFWGFSYGVSDHTLFWPQPS